MCCLFLKSYFVIIIIKVMLLRILEYTKFLFQLVLDYILSSLRVDTLQIVGKNTIVI
jgi:hypothetical protein